MKKIKLLFIILFSFILIYSSINLTLAYANSKTLIYDGKTNSFVYNNSKQADFFDDFKEVMPGDVISQEVKIKAININEPVSMYINMNTSEFNIYDYANIKIYGNDKLLFDSNNQSDDLIAVNKFKNNEEYNLKMVMSIPKEVGNEVEELSTNLKIDFVIEDNGKTYKVPKTFDDSNIYINIILLIVSIIMIIILVSKKENS